MRGRYALYGPISRLLSRVTASLLIVGAGLCSAQTYSAIDPPNTNSDIGGVPRLSILKTDGSAVAAPRFRGQVGFSGVHISVDGHRIGWLALMPNCCTSYPVPLKLVIFKGDKIERVIDEGIGVFDWTFENDDTRVAYVEDTLHFSTGKSAALRDIASGKEIARFGLERVDGEIPASVLVHAPTWVQKIPHIEK